MRRYLGYRPEEVPRIYRLLDLAAAGRPGHGPVHLLLNSASELGFAWDSGASFFLCSGAVDQGIMFGYADELSIEYEQRADELNSVHCKEVTGYSGRGINETGKFIKEKVIREREFIHKHGQPGLSL